VDPEVQVSVRHRAVPFTLHSLWTGTPKTRSPMMLRFLTLTAPRSILQEAMFREATSSSQDVMWDGIFPTYLGPVALALRDAGTIAPSLNQPLPPWSLLNEHQGCL
jgi:hypothetical protein